MRYLGSLNRGLRSLLESDDRVILLGEDIEDPYGGAFKVTRNLSRDFPGRVLNTPISESAIVGMAGGLALRGFRPIVEIMFSDFLTLAVDQIVNGLTKFESMYNGQVKCPVVIRTATGGGRGYGPTHSQSLESLFWNVPGLDIVAPSHLHNPGELLRQAVDADHPTLFVEHKRLYPEVLWTTETAAARGWCMSREGGTVRLHSPHGPTEAAIVTYGGMAPLAIEAAEEAGRAGYPVDVIAVSQAKPFDLTGVLKVLAPEQVVIAEESRGWGAEVSCQITEVAGAEVIRVQAKDASIPAAPGLEASVLPGVKEIYQAAISRVA